MQIFSNNAASTLYAGIDAVTTSIVLVDANKFPSPTGGDYFLLTVARVDANGQEDLWEIMKCTGRTGNTLTVTRAQEGTTAVSASAGSPVSVRVTAGSMSDPTINSLTVKTSINNTALTASSAVFTDASKNLVSVGTTGTGNVVRDTNAVLVTPNLGTPSALVGTNISGTASNLTAGTVTINAAMTGDVTSNGTTNATTIGNNKVTLAHMATMATASLLGRNTAATGNVEVLSVATTKTMLGLNNVDNTSDANKPVSTATSTALSGKQDTSSKDASGGYAGLTLMKINFKNVLNTFTSYFTNSNTASRTYTFPDSDGTVHTTGTTGALATGLVKNTTSTGVLSIAAAGTDYQAPIGTISGLVKGNGANALTAATVRTDYAEPTTALATGLLKNTTTTGAHTIAVAGTDYVAPGGALGTPSSGTLTNCTFPTLNQNTTGYATNLAGGNNTTLLGSIPYQSNTNVSTLLSPNTTTTKKFLRQTGTGTNGAAPAWDTLVASDIPALTLENLPDAWTKKAVKAATTADLAAASATASTITGTLVVFPAQDTITINLNDRILVKNQTTAAQNGIYTLTTVGVAATTAWVLTRATDADTASELAGACVAVDQGTTNGGKTFDTDFKSTDTVGTTAMTWNYLFDSGQTIPVANGGTGATTLTGIVKGNGTGAFTAATVRTDYAEPTTALATGILKNTTSTGAHTIAVAGTDYQAPIGTISGLAKGNGANALVAATAGTDYSAGTSALATGIVKSTTATGALSIAVAGTDYQAPIGTISGMVKGNGANALTAAVAGTDYRGPTTVAATVTAGTNAQGQGALTSDYNVVTTAAANPSGVTLPTATVGRSVVIVNRGANPINVYPATGGTIDTLAANAAMSIPVNGRAEFNASSTTQWYSSKGEVAPLISGLATGLMKVTTATGAITTATANTDYVAPTGADGLLTRWMFQDCGWDYYDSTTTNALNFVNGSHQRWAPAVGAQTLSITNWPPAGALGELLIEGVNLGASTITWPTINWIKSDGTTTTTFSSNGVTLQSSGTDWIILWTRDAGTTIYGKVVR